jgi:diketogulonate reductase-like aldo/keto reductase
LWNDAHHPDRVASACKGTLADLGLEYLDLYLMHWPLAYAFDGKDTVRDAGGYPVFEPTPISVTWAEMEKLVPAGLVRHIGVSNFPVILLHDFLKTCKMRPEVNQVELHVYNQQWELIEYCRKNGINCTAHSPLCRVGTLRTLGVNVSTDPVIVKIAQKRKKTPAHVCTR